MSAVMGIRMLVVMMEDADEGRGKEVSVADCCICNELAA